MHIYPIIIPVNLMTEQEIIREHVRYSRSMVDAG